MGFRVADWLICSCIPESQKGKGKKGQTSFFRHTFEM
jgi:hypothetical protein